MKSKILGVAGGNGVLLYPFRDNLLGNIEPRPIFGTPNDIQWKLNFPHIPLEKSQVVAYSKNRVEVIMGAPDCGHSSMFALSRAKRLGNPKENESLTHFIAQVNYYQPKAFMMENLPKLMDTWGSDLASVFNNYRLINFVESVAVFGNSQVTRIRLVIVGIRKDLPKEIDKLVTLPTSAYPLKTEDELLQGLGKDEIDQLCHNREPDDFMVCLIYGEHKKISVKKARLLWKTKYKDLKKWPVNKGNLKNQPGIYRNFGNDYPLTVRKQNRQFNSKGYMLSPREMARIQGIPDSFKLWYKDTQKLYSINKARVTVAKSPPYEIGVWFKGIIEQIEKLW